MCRVRMWISSGRFSMKAAKRAALKHGPTLLCLSSAAGDRVEASVEVACGVALEAAGCFAWCLAFGDAALDVGDRGGVLSLAAAEHDRVEGAVELAVAAAVEAMADRLAGGRGDRRGAGDTGEGGLASDPAWMRPRDQELSGADRPDSRLVAETGSELVDEAGDLLVEHVGLVAGLQGPLCAGPQGKPKRAISVAVLGVETQACTAGEESRLGEPAELAA